VTAAYPGVPLASFVRLTSPDGPFSPSSFTLRGRDPEVATLYSAASIASVPGGRPPLHATFHHASTLMPPNTLRSMKSEISMAPTDIDAVHDHRTAYEAREFAADAEPLNTNPDAVIAGSPGLVRAILLNDRMHALTVDTTGEVAVWDIVRGVCRGWFAREEVRAASRCCSTSSSGPRHDNGSVTGGDKERSPREALEAVRERIEGDAVSSPWSSVDTKTGVLTVHINERCFDSEIYADEAGFDHDRHFSDELRCKNILLRVDCHLIRTRTSVNIGRWVLRNLFLGFIREEQRIRRKRDTHGSETGHSAMQRTAAPPSLELNGNSSSSTLRRSFESSTRPPRVLVSSAVIISTTCLPAILPSLPSLTRPSPLLTPMIPLVPPKSPPPLSIIPQLPPNDTTPGPRPIRTQGLDPVTSLPSASRDLDYFSPHPHTRRPSTGSTALSDAGDFSAWSGPPNILATPTPSTPTSGSGFMGRLKSLGKGTVRKTTSDILPGSPISSPSGNLADTPIAPEVNLVNMKICVSLTITFSRHLQTSLKNRLYRRSSQTPSHLPRPAMLPL
jgi:WD repeat-containing protein 48